MSRVEEAATLLREADCLFDAAAVTSAYDAIAARLNADYAGTLPLVLCVMNGGLYATSEITQRLTFAFELDYLHATRYRGATQGGGLIWKRQPDTALEGRDVIVIDDILDEGHTLVAIRKALLEFNPKSLKVAVLAEKLHDRRYSVKFDGFSQASELVLAEMEGALATLVERTGAVAPVVRHSRDRDGTTVSYIVEWS